MNNEKNGLWKMYCLLDAVLTFSFRFMITQDPF